MMNWLYLHLRAIGHALGRLAGQPLGTLLSALLMLMRAPRLSMQLTTRLLNGVAAAAWTWVMFRCGK